MSILYGDINPFQTCHELNSWGENTQPDKMQQIGLGDERGIITTKWKLAIGVNRGIEATKAPCFFFLGAMGLLVSTESGA
jgi:hypothetical protein